MKEALVPELPSQSWDDALEFDFENIASQKVVPLLPSQNLGMTSVVYL